MPPTIETGPWTALTGPFSSKMLPGQIAPLTSPLAPWRDAAPFPQPYAVLMLFIPPTQEAAGVSRILFMKRSTNVRHHKGQIGFAGGRAELGDTSPGATALREFEEELGIQPSRVQLVGLLPALPAIDGALVYPVVGAAALSLDELKPSPDEVAEVFAAPWTHFSQDQSQSFSFNIFGNWRTSRLFKTPGRTIWGLTAEILTRAALGP